MYSKYLPTPNRCPLKRETLIPILTNANLYLISELAAPTGLLKICRIGNSLVLPFVFDPYNWRAKWNSNLTHLHGNCHARNFARYSENVGNVSRALVFIETSWQDIDEFLAGGRPSALPASVPRRSVSGYRRRNGPIFLVADAIAGHTDEC